MNFSEFDLDPRCIEVLAQQNITEPTPVQAQAIPVILGGRDVIAIAQTGTGKTLGFSLPGIERLLDTGKGPARMLILVPTRELCHQVEQVIETLCKATGMRSIAIYGGVGIDKQAKALRDGATIIVATPGRLLDHMGRRNVRFDNLAVLVLDEADRMLDMGFLPDLQRIVRQLPQSRQTLMFSATFPNEIASMAATMLHDPQTISVGAIAKPVDTVRQVMYPVHQHDKPRLLQTLIEDHDMTSTLIFMRTKNRTEQVAQILRRKNLNSAQIHGDRSQIQRQQALDGFRSGKFDILVATDVASRGLDIQGVSHVINYDIPLSPDDYIHRIGRTARAEAEGDAITFVCPDEYKPLESLERTLGYNIPRGEWEGAPRVLTLFKPASSTPRNGTGATRTRARRRPPARRRRR